jgi:dermatan/chondrotin sulfate uronyl 2-O-sulfotransferase UST
MSRELCYGIALISFFATAVVMLRQSTMLESYTSEIYESNFEEIEKSEPLEIFEFEPAPTSAPKQLVVYNRVPKCGSTTTLQIIDSLKRMKHFSVFNDIAPGMTHLMKSDEQELELVRNITNLEEPMLYIRHIYFIDFPRYGFKDPIYVNIVRDPVSLFISNYYYHRFGFEGADKAVAAKWKMDMPDDVRNMTLDDCVKNEEKECARPWSELLLFFCGHSNICRKRGDEALAIAKQKVLERYAIVGIVEDFENTMKSFEVVAPHFFAGAAELLNDEEEAKKRKSSKTAHKDEPSNETLEYLRERLKREYELYDFIKKTFYEKIEQFKSRGQWNF